MHIGKSRLVAVASAAALATLSFAGPALAHDGDRRGGGHGGGGHGGGGHADFSIQDAVDAAKPGDTIRIPPGTYDESVEITKDHLELRGKGVVIAPRTADPTSCDEPPPGTPAGDVPDPLPVSGICIFGDVVYPQDPLAPADVRDAVEGVSIRGVTVVDATGHGLIGLGTVDLSIRDSKFEGNDGYGAASFVTHKTSFRGNVATGNAEAGFYVGDSPDSRADVRGNYSADNELGFFMRNASHGKVRGNVAEGNCLGMLVLAGAPGPAVGWELRDNRVKGNNKDCEGPEPGTTISGAGIVMFGATEFRVRDNKVTGHESQSPATTLAAGGIVVIPSFPGPAGVTLPSGTVEDNRARDNQPADVVAMQAEAVDFDDNRCETSVPADLCNGRS